jgi:hypothetical protein
MNAGGWNFKNLSRTTSSPYGVLRSNRVCKISAILLNACPTVTSTGSIGTISYSDI